MNSDDAALGDAAGLGAVHGGVRDGAGDRADRLRGAAAMTDEERRMFSNRLRERADEIERLTAGEEQRAERLRLYMNRIGELEADNERLREQVAALQATSGFEISIARFDNERLRVALQEIADYPYVGTKASQKIWAIARRALEPKP